MKDKVCKIVNEMESSLIQFAQDIISIPSYSGQEKAVISRIKQEMENLDYDDILIDSLGSIVGVIGNGPEKILFDAHIDTVEVIDEEQWDYPPFGGEIHDGKLYGRGASDMKSSAASMVYAGGIMKKLNMLEGKTVYICCSALEEDFDGEGTYNVIMEHKLSPDMVIICEPTHNKISIGQRGRSTFTITTKGVSAHGSAPEKGVNAIYNMSGIINRINQLSDTIMKKTGKKGSIVISKIESTSVSLNAVPDSCTIYIDRRTTLEEDYEYLKKELNNLIEGIDATWDVFTVHGKSWQGKPVTLHSHLPAWEIDEKHPLLQKAMKCYRDLMKSEPELYQWDFSTNGVATAGKLGIPTIGFGAGIEKMAHQTNEYCPVEDIIQACQYFILLVYYL